MKKTLTRCAFAVVSALLLIACSGTETEIAPNRRVVLMYAAAYSNLSPSIAQDVSELCEGDIPYIGSDDILLVYSHHTHKNQSDYTTPTNPVLFRAYKDFDGQTRSDTLKIYPSSDVSSTAAVLNQVLTEVKESFPARSYGLIFSSHARGWLPVNYQDDSVEDDMWTIFSRIAPSMVGDNPWGSDGREFPMTKWLGIEKPIELSGIDIRDLADAIPMKLDFFLMDACLMGCVEVAYELKDKCNYIVFSPTEILSNGFIYTLMSSRLLNVASPDLEQVCRDYMDFYNSQSGYYQAATVTMVDCSGVRRLAEVCAEIIAAHKEGIEGADREEVQHYYYFNGSDTLPWFYDLRDVLDKAGATEGELARLDAALNGCVVYSGATPKFFDLHLDRVCGLSMYLPYPDKDELNDYYKTLAWNKATGLIQ